MTTAAHYAENYAALAQEPFIRSMAQDTITKELPFKLTHESADDPTFEFMQISRAAYHRALESGQATTTPESIGAVAHAILLVRAELLKAMGAMSEHEALAVYEPQNAQGYRWRPTCTCGWTYGWGMVSEEAARTLAEDRHAAHYVTTWAPHPSWIVEGTYSTWVSANGTRGTSWSPR